MQTSRVLLLATLAATGAQAATPLTFRAEARSGPVTLSQMALTAAPNSIAFATDNLALPAVAVAQFNPGRGILLGATASVAARLKTHIAIGAVAAPPGDLMVTARTFPGMNVKVNGINTAIGGALFDASCAAAGCAAGPGLNVVEDIADVSGSRVITAPELALVRGSGDVSFARTALDAAVLFVAGGTADIVASERTVIDTSDPAANRYVMDYDYLKFAQPQFGNGKRSLTISFGQMVLGSGLQMRNFSMRNAGDNNSAAYVSAGVSPTGATSGFLLAGFNPGPIAGGEANNVDLYFLPQMLGAVRARYQFQLIDHAPGGLGGRTHNLTLNIVGRVTSTASVPEPANWALLLLGFGIAGAVLRRQRAASTAGA